jgi:glutamine phosphoribosylpyrophosphate amidotransferase
MYLRDASKSQVIFFSFRTKTLKKLILDADGFIKNVKPLKNELNKQKINLNTDIMANMVENEEKDIINKLKELKNKILQ